MYLNNKAMKKIAVNAMLAATLLFGFGCNNNARHDSVGAAKEQNDKKIDQEAKPTANEPSKSDQKDEADYLVDLVNTGMTELELSKVAVKKAVTPQVKEYAEKVIAQHKRDENTLKEMAAKKNITLPAEISKADRDMLDKLASMKSDRDFDKKYVDDMKDINDKAIDKGKGVLNNSEDNELHSYVDKIIADDREHADQASHLKDIIDKKM
jgi:putative membrane protein